MLPNELVLPDSLDTVAITAGALMGGMYATRKGLDVTGVLFVSFSTGVGGGLIRDILLQNGIPALLTHPMFQLYAVVGAFVALFFSRIASRFNPLYEALDTFMIGVWALLGCSKAEEVGLQPISVLFIGTVAAVGGMLLRDLLCHDPPALMRPGLFYGLAAFAAAGTFVAFQGAGATMFICQVSALIAAIATRVLSVQFNIVSPSAYDITSTIKNRFRRTDSEPSSPVVSSSN